MLSIVPFGVAPRTGLAAVGKSVVEAFIATPLYQALVVPQARATMVKTAEANGVPWTEAKEWIEGQGDWEMDEAALAAAEPVDVPEYYRRPFHAYDEGNLCWEAAWEQEVAGRAVGARNFPAYGSEGEDAFRGAFDDALDAMGAHCPPDATLVDFGCATGVSTRRLAERYPQARSIVGLDLSPYMIVVGRSLLARAGYADGRRGAGGLRLLLTLCADDTVLVVAFAGRGDLVHVQLDLDLAAEVAVTQHRAQDLGDLRAQLVFHARLHVEPIRFGAAL